MSARSSRRSGEGNPFGYFVHVFNAPDAGVRFFCDLLLALALFAFVWLVLGIAAYVLIR